MERVWSDESATLQLCNTVNAHMCVIPQVWLMCFNYCFI